MLMYKSLQTLAYHLCWISTLQTDYYKQTFSAEKKTIFAYIVPITFWNELTTHFHLHLLTPHMLSP